MIAIDAFAARLRDAGFAGEIETGPATSAVYGTDNSIYQTAPIAAVVPTSIDDLAILARTNDGLVEPFALVARGGGTGTNGQSLTDGIVVDTRRAMNRIVSVDVEARTAVVEPGVVKAELDARLAAHGLQFAPHTSTATRCTVGGMVATDAAGKGSLVHGRTNRHVLAIEAVLADGTVATFHATDGAAPPPASGRIGDLVRALAAAVDGLDRDEFPAIPRGFSGYNLVDAVERPEIDVTKILCGSEGTLALTGRITVRLTPLAADVHLAVVGYPTFEEALHDAGRLTVTRPTAIECLDERTISLATSSPAWPALAGLLDVGGGALLLLEYDGPGGPDELRRATADRPVDRPVAVTTDTATIAAVWKVRADAVGLLGRPVGGRRSVPFVEDCAVPPAHLDEFVRRFRSLLDEHGVEYGMFGHADVGCIHVRPALDLMDPDHERLVREIGDSVAELVAGYGGVLWGEHGRGFRGEYLDLAPGTVHRMRLVKTAFDPRHVLNPGKLYTPVDDPTPIVAIDEVPLRVHHDRRVADDRRDDFESAFDCNGNGICHHWGDAEAMCPSFKVTLDPRLSPKGRADLTRAWLAAPHDRGLADEVAASMRACLSCGACTGRCPVQVDVPELKSRFLAEYRDRDIRRRLRTALLGRFESVLPAVQRRVPTVAQRLASPALRLAFGLVDLPTVPARGLAARLDTLGVPLVTGAADVGDATVVILPDAFTAVLEPDVLEATVSVLRAVGERPAVAPFVPSGKADHVAGRRARFRRAVARRRTLIESFAGAGVDLVVIEPAIALMGAHECRAVDPSFPADAVESLAVYLGRRVDRLPAVADRGAVRLFPHCTEGSLEPAAVSAARTVLEATGHDVTVEATTCCGMAGGFGHQVEHQAMSTALFDRSWRPRLAGAGPTRCAASGYSCRSQARRHGFGDVVHPVQLLAEAIGS